MERTFAINQKDKNPLSGQREARNQLANVVARRGREKFVSWKRPIVSELRVVS